MPRTLEGGENTVLGIGIASYPRSSSSGLNGDRHSKQSKVILLRFEQGDRQSVVTAKAASGFTEKNRVTIMHY